MKNTLNILLNTRKVTGEVVKLIMDIDFAISDLPVALVVLSNTPNSYADYVIEVPEGQEVTNEWMRGYYHAHLNRGSDLTMYIDDDFEIVDTEKFRDTIRVALYLFGYNPDIRLVKLSFNGANSDITGTTPVTSTSMECGIIVRGCGFTDEQMKWNWHTDDFTIVLNALKYGTGVTLNNHGVVHHIGSKSDELTFNPEWTGLTDAVGTTDIATDENGQYIYNRGLPNDVRSILQNRLKELTNENRS